MDKPGTNAGGGGAVPNADSTMAKPRGKPSGENMPPAGGESMAPADSRHPHAPPGGRKNVANAPADDA